MMKTEITSPCCLHLGFAHAEDGALCGLGITLQHPQIQLVARPSQTLSVSGARADVAYSHATSLNLTGYVEIEIAIPAHMGLGSDEMLRATVVRGLNPKDLEDSSGLYAHAFAEGGLVVVDEDGVLRHRVKFSSSGEEDDWVFVLVLPKEPDDIADDFEAKQLTKLRKSAHMLTSATSTDALFDSIAHYDFDAFTKALAEIHAANEAALAANGQPIEPSAQDREILSLMRANGAVMNAQALTGLGLYGLVKGRLASSTLRKALTQHLGYFGPLVTASICDNAGARVKPN